MTKEMVLKKMSFYAIIYKKAWLHAFAILCFISIMPLPVWCQADTTRGPVPLPMSPSAMAGPSPMPMPGMAGILKPNPKPIGYKTGILGTMYITGVASGIGQWQNTVSPGDHEWSADVSNIQIMIQKTDGVIQYYLQLGGYSIPDIGIPYTPASTTVKEFFGLLPQAFLKIVPFKNFSLMAGKLPTLIGAEYTFSFENLNIQRGLLWNQENDVNRGLQANYSIGPVTFSLSWNDGYYSQKYTWLWGAATYTLNSTNSFSFTGGGNVQHTAVSSLVTPLYQNNQQIYGLSYTHSSGKWMIVPYLQYTHVPVMKEFGVIEDASTSGAALYVNYSLKDDTEGHSINLPVRLEYIHSSPSSGNRTPNLLYGAGSKAFSVTLTPTYQYRRFFARPEFSLVKAMDYAPGSAFGADGNHAIQIRLLVEAGVLF